MILNDAALLKDGPDILDPFLPQNVQPASVDLRLDTIFLVPKQPDFILDGLTSMFFGGSLGDKIEETFIDLANIGKNAGPDTYDRVFSDRFILQPKQFVLASTIEKVKIPTDLVGCVEGRSSLGRLGLFVHVTAGFLDPGFEGKITLEIYNVNERGIILRSGLRICQMSLTQMTGEAMRPYGSEGLNSHYQHQTETTASRYDG